MKVEVTMNTAAVVAKIEGISKKAIPVMANELLKDSNYYCPEDSSELIKSSIRASRPNEGLLIWDEPYARRRYYTGTPRHGVNPNASLMWAQRAIGENKAKYTRMVQEIFDGEG